MEKRRGNRWVFLEGLIAFFLTLSLHPGEFKLAAMMIVREKTDGGPVRSSRLASSSASIRAIQLSGLCSPSMQNQAPRGPSRFCASKMVRYSTYSTAQRWSAVLPTVPRLPTYLAAAVLSDLCRIVATVEMGPWRRGHRTSYCSPDRAQELKAGKAPRHAMCAPS